MVWVAQEAGKRHVSRATIFVPIVKVHVSGGLMLCWDFFDADTLVPCSFLAETSTENLQHEALTSLKLRKNSGSVFLVDPKALQRHQHWCVANAVLGTQTSCYLDQFLCVHFIDFWRARFRICHEHKIPQLRNKMPKQLTRASHAPSDWLTRE